jgi:hypothetical protein
MNFLATSPIWLTGGLLVGGMTLLAMAGPFLIRRWIPLRRLRANNEIAGFKFATVGVLYAVLLAFAVLVVWERFNESESSVAMEAGAAATLYRLADGLGGAEGEALHAATSAYLEAAIGDDWPAMEGGGASPAVTDALNTVYATLLGYNSADGRGQVVLAEALYQLDQLTQARLARIVAASGTVPDIVWLVLFSGALVTVGFTFFFGTESLVAQALMTGALSVLIFSGLLIVIAIDHPFAGSVRVEPEPLAAVLADFGTAPQGRGSSR